MWIAFAEKEDLEEILAMEKECFGAQAWTREMVINDFERRSSYILCRSDQDEYIGYLCILELDTECEILRLGVRKNFRKQGYAKSLLEFLFDHCINTKKEKIYLEVSSENAVAIKLYENLGFNCINIRKNYYKQGDDARIYIKLL